MLPATSSWDGNSFLRARTVSRTRWEWPWALSTTMTSHLAATRALARSRKSAPTPTAAPTQAVLGGRGVLDLLEDVLVGDQALEVVVLVDDEELLDLVVVEDLLRVLERRPDRDGDELLGHDLLDGQVQAALEADVAVGQDADELVGLVRDGQTGDVVLPHDLEGPGDLVLGPEGDGLDDHAALVALDLVDLLGLDLDREVAVDDADAALLGHGDGHARRGHGVHGRADEGDVEGDVAAQPGGDRGLLGDDVRLGRDDEDVVEG
jgi:hypothetical protein